jgi:ribosomal protein L1
MAKKAELLEQAKKLKLNVSTKNTIKEIEEAIQAVSKSDPADVVSKKEKVEKTDAVAKAGKRSAKALKEAEELQAKEDRKATGSADNKPAQPAKKITPTRSRLERRSKKYKDAAKKIDTSKLYLLKDAVKLALETSTTSFDATVEVHIRLNVDPRQADQNIRDTLILPAGVGKTIRVAVFADNDLLPAATKAGADIAKDEEFLTQLDKGELNFDVLIATPSMMPKLGKYARLLGPKGLMPNPKSGTVTKDIEKAVTESKAGKLEYRVDSSGIIHAGVGKVSFGEDAITENITTLAASIRSNKPSSIKGSFIQSVYFSTSMGPSIPVDITSFTK